VNKDGAVTPSDGYEILESLGKPEEKVGPRASSPLPDLPTAATPNVKRFTTAEVSKRDVDPRMERVRKSPAVEIKDADMQ
jgi:hypothetical protein